jgi:hypothetical protein
MSEETRERSFDELARGLASGELSRRKALRLMGAALVGGTLASLGIGGVAAADEECKPNGKKCRKNSQCCSGNCESGTCAAACVPNGGTCAIGSQCCSGNCKSGTCVASCIPPDAIVGCGTPTIDCPEGCMCSPEVSGARICRGPGVTDVPCTTSCDCPTGQACLNTSTGGSTGGLCTIAC